jgi:DNA-binding IclR family transcriptional regulator
VEAQMLTDGDDLCATGTAGGVPMSIGRSPGRSVLEGAFALLEALAEAEAGVGLGLTEAANRAGLPKSTAHRLLEQMCGIGAVERLFRGYVVGPLAGLLVQGRGRLHARIRFAVGGPAIRLAKLARADVAVCVLSGPEVVVVATFAGHSARLPIVYPGTVLPPATAVARVLLSGAHRAEHVVSGGELPSPCSDVVVEGVVIESELVLPGISCAAAPIYSPGGRVVAAIGVLSASARNLPQLGQLVFAAAAEAGHQLAEQTC